MNQNNPQYFVRLFNEDEAVWRCLQRNRLRFLLRGRRLGIPPEELERFAWSEAEAEDRPTRCVGREAP